MAYTIVKSDGTVLTTIADGTINTTSTSLGLPGRNFAGYGQALDTNFVHTVENFADSVPPANPLRGQLWYNTNNQTLYVCPADGETNPASWFALSSTSSGGTTTFGDITVIGNTITDNLTVTTQLTASQGTFTNITVTNQSDLNLANVVSANVGTVTTTLITTGNSTTTGTMIGTWTVSGGSSGNSLLVSNGNIYTASAVLAGNYFYANGTPFNPGGSYGNVDVASYLPVYGGNILTNIVQVASITTGGAGTQGNITGNWILTGGSRLQATYADLAERFEADDVYSPGTVVELGGEKEVTAVKYELSEDVFGVISNTAAYLMNATAGSDETHPPIAVTGRVMVKVKGQVKKNDRLVSAGDGYARAAKKGEANAFNTIGRSLTDKTSEGIGTVEAIVMIR